MRFATIWVAMAAATLLGAAPAAGAAPDPAQLVFSSGGELVTVAPDGSARTELPPPPAGHADSDPIWSPDGAMLAFVRELTAEDDLRGSRLLLSAPDGSGATTLVGDKRRLYLSPAWSPDGASLAVARTTLGPRSVVSEIVVVGRDGTGERAVARVRVGPRDRPVFLWEPAWSPDGGSIAYTRVRLDRNYDYRPDLRAVGLDGRGDRLLARDGAGADWSPDGSRIAYVSVRDRNGRRCGSHECFYATELYVMNAAGGDQVRLTHGKGDEQSPDWSPDGGWIAFSSDRNYPVGESPEIYSIRSDGSCLSWLTNGSPWSVSPAWRPEPGTSGDPGVCGGLEISPTFEFDLRPARRVRHPRLYWLGPSLGELLPSPLYEGWSGGRGAPLAYDDCVRFNPASCPPRVVLSQMSVCEMGQDVSLAVGRGKLRRVRGALMAARQKGTSLDVLTGGTVISMTSDDGGAASRARMLRRAVGALRPMGQRAILRRLPPPAIPGGVARRLRRADAVVATLGAAEAARRIDLPLPVVGAHVRLLEALRSGGPIHTVRCGR